MAKKLSPRANNTNTNEPAGTTRQVALRQIVAEQLAQHLATSELLLDRCTEIANTFGTDKIGALNAAARLLRAQAELAESIGRFSGVEQRQRTIVERIQTHLPAELIPKKRAPPRGHCRSRFRSHCPQAKILRRKISSNHLRPRRRRR